MRLKNSSVNPDLVKEFWEPLFAVDEFWRDALGYGIVITSARDGDMHRHHSLHYAGAAVDIRTWDKVNSGRQLHGTRREALLEMVAGLMGNDFQVLDEIDHFHIEYQPAGLGYEHIS